MGRRHVPNDASIPIRAVDATNGTIPARNPDKGAGAVVRVRSTDGAHVRDRDVTVLLQLEQSLVDQSGASIQPLKVVEKAYLAWGVALPTYTMKEEREHLLVGRAADMLGDHVENPFPLVRIGKVDHVEQAVFSQIHNEIEGVP